MVDGGGVAGISGDASGSPLQGTRARTAAVPQEGVCGRPTLLDVELGDILVQCGIARLRSL